MGFAVFDFLFIDSQMRMQTRKRGWVSTEEVAFFHEHGVCLI